MSGAWGIDEPIQLAFEAVEAALHLVESIVHLRLELLERKLCVLPC